MTIKIQRILSRAKKMTKNGKIKDAQNLYEISLKIYPQNKDLIKGLADIQIIKTQEEPPINLIQSIIDIFSNGKIKEAIIEIEVLINQYPSSPLLFNVSGAFHKSNGQLEDAIKKFKQAIILNSNYAEAHYNLGVVHSELDQIIDAIKNYEDALAIKNEYPDAHNNLGNILLNLDKIEAAARHFELAIEFNPQFSQAYNNLGITNRRRGHPLEAGKNFDKALSINPNYAEAANSRGNIFQDYFDQVNAIKFYKRALEINPNFVDAYNNIGLAEKELNNIDNAIESFKKALSINPNYARAYYNLSRFKQYRANKEEIKKMQSLLITNNISQYDRIALNFALAKVNEINETHDGFFNYLHKGNKLRKKELNYITKISEEQFSEIRKTFDLFPSSAEISLLSKPSSIRPIFIIGMPRSGTSLVEQIISCHNSVHGAGELNTLGILFSKLLDDFLNSDHKNKISNKTLLSVREEYLDTLYNLNSSKDIITDKAPGNFRFIGLIMTIFPNAKIIHLKRNPVATCWSIYNRNWSGNGYPFSYNLNDLGHYFNLYAKLMNHWHKKFPGKIYDISYEDLTRNQEEETRKLLEYCELEWDENCLYFYKNKRTVKTASLLQVREKMYQGSSEAWKKYEAYIQPLIDALKPYLKSN